MSFLDGNGYEYYVSINGTMDDERSVINETDQTVYLIEDHEKGETLTPIGEMGGDINVTKIVNHLFSNNIDEANAMSIFDFYEAVKGEGKWDYKSLETSIFYYKNNSKFQYYTEDRFYSMESQDFGNFHYGVVGKALSNVPELILRMGAGAAQILSGNSKPELITPGLMEFPHGDDPRDQGWIGVGFEHFNRLIK